ncbi:MAG: hypothetical protein WCI03_14420 [bacterium]
MKTVNKWVMVGMMSVVVAGMAIVGCESTKSTTDAITLTPASATLTNASSVTFVATLGNTNINAVLPLVWSVNDESLGHIEGRGMTAVYTPTDRHGNNNIKVRDQADGEGIAVVSQVEAGDSGPATSSPAVSSPAVSALTVSPISTTIGTTETKTFIVSGGTKPYNASMKYSSLSIYSSGGFISSSVYEYHASGAGTNTLTFTDSGSPVLFVTATVIQQ